MFIERPEDAEQAELFAMGLIKEPKDNGTLLLVPCRHKVFCRTHGTLWIHLRTNKSKIKIKTREILGK
jgi:hypothetical protein